jgi:putative ABC transport system ATP-binding protein
VESNLFRYAWRHSRRDQIIILASVLASLPFYWMSLELPKRIVNDAIQGRAFGPDKPLARLFEIVITLPGFLGGKVFTISDGVMLAQLPFLLALSGVYLALVLVNGGFKYWINIAKGLLGERLLRRMRYELFDRLMRLPPDDVRAVKPAEAATIIKDEVEPIGGFFGDAFVTPAFLGTQALTALLFIVAQNAWLGVIALAVISSQALVIPRLRREQLRLGRQRQLESRRLAGRISELVDAAPVLHVHGIGGYGRADIGDRLGRLFSIRALLYRRKFAVKYLNNLLAQITPFVFYTIGGYFALRGRLDIGQLVAIIAAYRDLPPPIKELIDWDQQRADASVKYEQVVGQFPKELLPPEDAADRAEPPPADAPIQISDLRVTDRRGVVQLERLSLTLERPGHVALVGAAGSGAEILAKVIGRQTTNYHGTVTVGDYDLKTVGDITASRFLIFAGGDPGLVSGSMRDNIRLVLKRAAPEQATLAGTDLREAEMTGNPVVSAEDDWIDYAGVGVSDRQGLKDAVTETLRLVGGYDDVFRLGSTVSVGSLDPETEERLVRARAEIRKRLAEAGLTRLVEPFDPDRYNDSATIGENIIFGVPTNPSLNFETLARHPRFRALLEAEGLTMPMARIGIRMAETIVEVLGQLAPGHPLIERFTLPGAGDVETLSRQLGGVTMTDGAIKLSDELISVFIGYAMSYVEPRHRLAVVDELFRRRVLRTRESFRKGLPGAYVGTIEFYDPERILVAAPIIDNLLFGRLAYGVPDGRARVNAVTTAAITDLGLVPFVLGRGLDTEVGPGGKLLSRRMRAIIQVVRAVLRRPDILVLDGALAGLGVQEARACLESIRAEWKGRTLVVAFDDAADAEGFDRVVSFDGASLIQDHSGVAAPAGTAGGERRLVATGMRA